MPPLRCFLSLVVLFLCSGPLSAQPAPEYPPLSGLEKRDLLLIAREALTARLEERDSRQPVVGPRLQVSQGLVASLTLGGELRARSWHLFRPMPLYEGARVVTLAAAEEPKGGVPPLSQPELGLAEISLAVLSGYTAAKTEKDIPPRSAVLVFNGFHEGVALPSDKPMGTVEELLDLACVTAGLRPRTWLLPETTILYAQADEGHSTDF